MDTYEVRVHRAVNFGNPVAEIVDLAAKIMGKR